MKKFFLFFFIFSLIIAITITKNSAKKLENKIFLVKENIRVLKDKYELVLLDYNYLSSPKKLFEYQNKYFDKDIIILGKEIGEILFIGIFALIIMFMAFIIEKSLKLIKLIDKKKDNFIIS